MPIGQKTTFDPVPDGTYLLRVTDCTERSRKDDSSQVFHSWSFEVMNDCEEAGRRVSIAMPSDMAVGSKLEKMWLAIGLPALALGEGFDTDDALGGEFYARVVVKQRKGNAGTKNEFESIWSIEEYEKEIAKATSGRRSSSPSTSSRTTNTARVSSAEQEEPEDNGGEAGSGEGESSNAAPRRPAAPQRPAGKSLLFPKGGAGSLKK
jgi:hypothetical protein